MSVPIHPSYQGAYDYDFEELCANRFRGLLGVNVAQSWRSRWLIYIENEHPRTRAIHREQYPDRSKRPQFISNPHKVGGLRIASGGATDQFWSRLWDDYAEEARVKAKEQRKAAGWLDDGTEQYRIPPSKIRNKNGGELWGEFALPGDEKEVPWSGTEHIDNPSIVFAT